MYEEIRKEAAAAAQEICQVAKLQKGQILVVGCSTSEVTGHTAIPARPLARPSMRGSSKSWPPRAFTWPPSAVST